MTLSLAIFLSALFIGTIVLFIGTKDRWNWAKGLKQFVLWFLSLAVIAGTLIGFGIWYSDRPAKQKQFIGVQLGASKEDIRFLKGDPSEDSTDNDWWYKETKTEYGQEKNLFYGVSFKENKVWFVVLRGSSNNWDYNIEGISDGASLDGIVKKFGNTFQVVSSKDGLTRIYMFPKYNSYFLLDEGTVYNMGIYDPKAGSLDFIYYADLDDYKFRPLPGVQPTSRKKSKGK